MGATEADLASSQGNPISLKRPLCDSVRPTHFIESPRPMRAICGKKARFVSVRSCSKNNASLIVVLELIIVIQKARRSSGLVGILHTCFLYYKTMSYGTEIQDS